MNSRILKLENTVNCLVGYIQNIKQDTNLKLDDLTESSNNHTKSVNTIFDSILEELKVSLYF
jgi:hypothetical protein